MSASIIAHGPWQIAATGLPADHRRVEDLFAEFEAAKGAAKKQALVEKICAELSGHTVIEEGIFYPASHLND